MIFYKLFKDGTFIDIATSDDCRCYQKKHNILLRCGADKAQLIDLGEKLYHGNVLFPAPDGYDVEEVSIYEIEEEEYNSLKSAKENDEEIPDIPVEIETDEIFEPEYVQDAQETFEYVQSSKLKELATACTKAIYSGFDVTLSDGLSHHFSLELFDQINLQTLRSRMNEGETTFQYHADGESTSDYSVEDLKLILNAADELRFTNQKKYNELSTLVKALTTIEEVSAVSFDS